MARARHARERGRCERPTKRELDGTAFARSKVVVDFVEQTLRENGELQDAIRTGAITANHIHAELGDIITGRKPGRENDEEITLFKSVVIAGSCPWRGHDSGCGAGDPGSAWRRRSR